MKLAEYQALVAKERGKNDDPEHRLQCGLAICLLEALPPEVDWTANAAGVRVTAGIAGKMKAAGVRPDWPDRQFLFPDRITRYTEVKTQTGKLSTGQKRFRLQWEPLGIWSLARCWDDLEAALATWCAENRLALRPLHPLTRARYGQ